MTFVSYAQNFEDVMLWRALKEVDEGFYIDIGAQDPIIDSVSYAFYLQGWRGVHVEPAPQYANKIAQARPDEALEQALVSGDDGPAVFYVIADTGLSTADVEVAETHSEKGFEITQATATSITLDALLEKYGTRDIHWLKIDVEGFETKVLDSWNHSEVRPWILVIESTEPMTQRECHSSWEDLVLHKGYEFAYFDGLNRFYVHCSRLELKEILRAPPNVFDNFALSGTASNPFCSIIAQHETLLKVQLSETQQSLDETSSQLSGKSEELLTLKAQHEGFQEAYESLTTENKYLKDSLSALGADLEEKLERLSVLTDTYTEQSIEISRLNERLDATHLALHRILTSRVWKLTLPLRWLAKHWPTQQVSRLSPSRVKAGSIRRVKGLVLRGILYVNDRPKLKTACRNALTSIGAYGFLQARYRSYRNRVAQQVMAPVVISGLGQRAGYIYEDLLRRKNKQ
jgi:FkbM family methyltransferase